MTGVTRACIQEKVLRHAEELFEEGDENKDGRLSSAELQALLLKVGSVACHTWPSRSMSGNSGQYAHATTVLPMGNNRFAK